jgi:hypothetical protein
LFACRQLKTIAAIVRRRDFVPFFFEAPLEAAADFVLVLD